MVGSTLVIIIWIIYTIICEIIYHKLFKVYYFSLGQGCVTELFGCAVVGALLTALTLYLYIPLIVIIIILGIVLPIVIPAVRDGDVPGKVLIRVLAVILAILIFIAGKAWKTLKEDGANMVASVEQYSSEYYL